MKTAKTVGYLVVDSCDDAYVALRLEHDDKTPPKGVLTWEGNGVATIFESRSSAVAAINRTEHFRHLWGLEFYPGKSNCKILRLTGEMEISQ